MITSAPVLIGTATVRGVPNVVVMHTDGEPCPWITPTLVDNYRWHHDSDVADFTPTARIHPSQRIELERIIHDRRQGFTAGEIASAILARFTPKPAEPEPVVFNIDVPGNPKTVTINGVVYVPKEGR